MTVVRGRSRRRRDGCVCHRCRLARRVPNALTFPAVVAGIAAHGLLPGGQGSLVAIGGALVGLAVFFPIFALGGMGGGDVKLMAALGAWVGPAPIVWTALYGAVAGGVMAVVVGASAAATSVRPSPTSAGCCSSGPPRACDPVPALTLEHGKGPRLPYALPIARRAGRDVMATLTRRRRWSSERGAELIEMVVVLPLLMLVDVRHRRLRLHVPALRRADQRGDGRGAGGHPARLRASTMRSCGPKPTPPPAACPAGEALAEPLMVTLAEPGGGAWPALEVTVTHPYTLPVHRADRRRCSAASFPTVHAHRPLDDAPAARILKTRRDPITCHEPHGPSSSSRSRCWSPAAPASSSCARCRAFRSAKWRSANYQVAVAARNLPVGSLVIGRRRQAGRVAGVQPGGRRLHQGRRGRRPRADGADGRQRAAHRRQGRRARGRRRAAADHHARHARDLGPGRRRGRRRRLRRARGQGRRRRHDQPAAAERGARRGQQHPGAGRRHQGRSAAAAGRARRTAATGHGGHLAGHAPRTPSASRSPRRSAESR